MMRVPKTTAPPVSIPKGKAGSRTYSLNTNVMKQHPLGSSAAFRQGQEWQAFIPAFEKAGKATAMIAEQVSLKRDEAESNEAYAGLAERINEYLHGEEGIYSRTGKAAFGSVENVKNLFKEQERLKAKTMSPGAARLFGQQAERLRFSVIGAVARHEGVEMNNWYIDTDKKALETDKSIFLNVYDDDRQSDETLARFEERGRAMMERMGKSAGEIEAVSAFSVSGLVADRIGLLVKAGDVERARELAGHERLLPRDRQRAQAVINSELVRREADERALHAGRESVTALVAANRDVELGEARASGDFRRLISMEEQLAAVGEEGSARDIREARELLATAHATLSSLRSLPFMEQARQAEQFFESLESLHRPEHVEALRDAFAQSLQEEAELFRYDPAGYAGTMLADEQGRTGQAESLHAKARRRMHAQTLLAKDLPGFTPRVLTNDEANSARMAALDPDIPAAGKMERLLGLQRAYGDLAPQVWKEIDLPPAVRSAVAIAADSHDDRYGIGRDLLAAALMPEKDVPASDIAPHALHSSLNNNEYMRFHKELAAAFPYNASIVERWAGLQEAGSRLARISGAGTLDRLSRPYHFVTDDNMYVQLTRESGINPSDAWAALVRVRASIGRHGTFSEREIDVIRSQGVWVGTAERADLIVDGRRVFSVNTAQATRDYLERQRAIREEAMAMARAQEPESIYAFDTDR